MSANNLKELNQFLPGVLQVMETPPNRTTRVILWAIVTFILIGVAWSFWGKLDVVVVARGKLIPQGKSLEIQARSSGSIGAINVVENQKVDKGQVLIVINNGFSESVLQSLQAESLFLNKKRQFYQSIFEQSAQANFELSAIPESLKQDYSTLLDIKEFSKPKQGNNRKERNLDLQSRILTRVVELEEKQKHLDNEIQKMQSLEIASKVLAVESGSVQGIKVNYQGVLVSSGQTLLTLVPEERKLLAQVMFENKDVGFVKPGLEVKLKFDTYRFNKYGTIKGKVLSINQDIEENSQYNGFWGLVELESDALIWGEEKFLITPGMSLVAESKIGERRVVDFILSPLNKKIKESGKEI